MTFILPGGAPYSSLIDLDRIHAELVEYKVVKGYANIFIPRMALREILASRCEIRMLMEEANNPLRLQQAAARVLKMYLDRFVRLRERHAESAHAEPGRRHRADRARRGGSSPPEKAA